MAIMCQMALCASSSTPQYGERAKTTHTPTFDVPLAHTPFCNCYTQNGGKNIQCRVGNWLHSNKAKAYYKVINASAQNLSFSHSVWKFEWQENGLEVDFMFVSRPTIFHPSKKKLSSILGATHNGVALWNAMAISNRSISSSFAPK